MAGNSEACSEAYDTSEEVDIDSTVEGKIIMATTDSANLKYLTKNIKFSTGESYCVVLRPKIVTYSIYEEEDSWCLITIAMFAHHRREKELLAMDSLQLQYVEDASKVACIKKIDRNFCEISVDLASPDEFISFDCEQAWTFGGNFMYWLESVLLRVKLFIPMFTV